MNKKKQRRDNNFMSHTHKPHRNRQQQQDLNASSRSSYRYMPVAILTHIRSLQPTGMLETSEKHQKN
ncbi:hypothetical protein TgHK011_004526 [Trichoderma gracile]|nr:hypothetical protein TgHK011_004526 [Trichoderma gracile]